jgi:hypothetical protein
VANTLAYYDTATITAVKSFIVQAPGDAKIKSIKQNLFDQMDNIKLIKHFLK